MAPAIWVNTGSGNGLVPSGNVDLSSARSSDIHLRASSQEIPQPSITEIIWKINDLKCHWNLPGANELNPKPLLQPVLVDSERREFVAGSDVCHLETDPAANKWVKCQISHVYLSSMIIINDNVINSLCAKFFQRKHKCICTFYVMPPLWYVTGSWDQDLPILHSQYYGCWCLGDTRSQGISNHDTDLVEPR